MDGRFNRSISSAELKRMEQEAQKKRDNEEVRVLSTNRTVLQQTRLCKKERTANISPVLSANAQVGAPRDSSTPNSFSEESVLDTMGPAASASSTVLVPDQTQGPPSGNPPVSSAPVPSAPPAPQQVRMDGWGSVTGPVHP